MLAPLQHVPGWIGTRHGQALIGYHDDIHVAGRAVDLPKCPGLGDTIYLGRQAADDDNIGSSFLSQKFVVFHRYGAVADFEFLRRAAERVFDRFLLGRSERGGEICDRRDARAVYALH